MHCVCKLLIACGATVKPVCRDNLQLFHPTRMLSVHVCRAFYSYQSSLLSPNYEFLVCSSGHFAKTVYKIEVYSSATVIGSKVLVLIVACPDFSVLL